MHNDVCSMLQSGWLKLVGVIINRHMIQGHLLGQRLYMTYVMLYRKHCVHQVLSQWLICDWVWRQHCAVVPPITLRCINGKALPRSMMASNDTQKEASYDPHEHTNPYIGDRSRCGGTGPTPVWTSPHTDRKQWGCSFLITTYSTVTKFTIP